MLTRSPARSGAKTAPSPPGRRETTKATSATAPIRKAYPATPLRSRIRCPSGRAKRQAGQLDLAEHRPCRTVQAVARTDRIRSGGPRCFQLLGIDLGTTTFG